MIRPVFGVDLDPRLSDYVTRRLGIEGVLIRGVDPGSPAEAAGLEGSSVNRRSGVVPGDVVQEIDGKPVKSVGDLLGRLGSYRPGDTVALAVWREGKTRTVRVRLKAPE